MLLRHCCWCGRGFRWQHLLRSTCKSRVWDKVSDRIILIFGDTRIPFQHNIGQAKGCLYLDPFCRFDTIPAFDRQPDVHRVIANTALARRSCTGKDGSWLFYRRTTNRWPVRARIINYNSHHDLQEIRLQARCCENQRDERCVVWLQMTLPWRRYRCCFRLLHARVRQATCVVVRDECVVRTVT